MMQSAKFSLLLTVGLLVSSCGNKTEPAAISPAPAAKPAAAAKPGDHGGLENQPMAVPTDNPITPEKVELGKQLFFDERLSKTGKMSCESCHHPDKGWTA